MTGIDVEVIGTRATGEDFKSGEIECIDADVLVAGSEDEVSCIVTTGQRIPNQSRANNHVHIIERAE